MTEPEGGTTMNELDLSPDRSTAYLQRLVAGEGKTHG